MGGHFGGLAVGVHTTQFAIRDPRIGLFEPVLKVAAEEMDRADKTRDEPLVRIAGICGDTAQAIREAQLLSDLGYHAGLLSLAALKNADNHALVQHCRAISGIVPIIGFYLQPAAGGRPSTRGRRSTEPCRPSATRRTSVPATRAGRPTAACSRSRASLSASTPSSPPSTASVC